MQSMGQSEKDGRPLFLYEGKTLYEWLPAIVERVAKRFDPLKIIVFGSVARGEAGHDSDVDLLVVFEHVQRENKRKLAVDIRVALVDVPVPIDIVVTDSDEISRRGHLVGPILRPALREGKILHERS